VWGHAFKTKTLNLFGKFLALSFVRRYGILWDNELAMAAEQNGQDLEAFLNLTSGNRMMLLEILHRNNSIVDQAYGWIRADVCRPSAP
jgi:hypothetical protein